MSKWAFIVVLASAAAWASDPAASQPASSPSAPTPTWDDAIGLLSRAGDLVEADKYDEALPLVRQLVSVVRQVGGPKTTQLADSLEKLASLYRRTGKPVQAEPLYVEALTIRRDVQGDKAPEAGYTLVSLAETCWELDRYEDSARHCVEALAIFEAAEGPDGENVLLCLTNLAHAWRAMGEYRKALPLSERALALSRKRYPPEHPTIATGLNNLGTLYADMGDCARAEPLVRQALDIRVRLLGQDNPELANSYNNLAGLCQNLGLYDKAEPLYLKSLQIRRQAHGPEHSSVATALANLSVLYYDMGRYDESGQLGREALEIHQKVSGQDSLEVARSLGNLATVYYQAGELQRAVEALEKAIAIRTKHLGADHPSHAINLNNLANVHDLAGRHDKAYELYRRAMDIQTRRLGPDHPDLVSILESLAGNRVAAGKPREALEPLRQAAAITRRQTEMVLGFSSEADKLAFLRMVQGGLEMRLTLACRELPEDPEANAMAAEAILQYKGLALESLTARQAVADDPAARKAQEELAAVLRETARLTFDLNADSKERGDRLVELDRRRDRLEADLSRLSSDWATRQQSRRADADSVSRALPPGAAVLEIGWYKVFNYHPQGRPKAWLEPRYVAFVFRPGRQAPKRVDLGPAEKIDQAVLAFRDAIRVTHGAFRGLDVSPMRQEAKVKARDEVIAAARRLHDLVFSPIQPSLGDADHVLISPETFLTIVPFEAMVAPDGRFLVERYAFSYLVAGRDVLRMRPADPKAEGAVILADPDFEALPATDSAPSVVTGSSEPPRGLVGTRFDRLPGTAEEAARVAELLGVPAEKVLRGAGATKAALLSLPHPPRVLHVATHGFFLRDTLSSDAATRPAEGSRAGVFGPGAHLTDPLLGTGLALAGANVCEAGDGLLTALEVAGMSLQGTELVVLSACETGRGVLEIGQGVFGLPRAFFQAGARSLVNSLWKVPDRETAELMECLYAAWRDGKGKAPSLRQAQLEMIRRLREKSDGFAHPFFWAGFVLLGEWDGQRIPGR